MEAALAALPYREVWATDFEFIAHPGERQAPVCLVAHELRTGRKINLWRDQFGPMPPYPTDAGALFVAYYASAELGCHRALGWPMPERILDLFTEFVEYTNGLWRPSGSGLLGALVYFGLEHIDATEKTEMRDLVMRGGPWSSDEREAILDYCESDILALGRLLPAMLPRLDLALAGGERAFAVSPADIQRFLALVRYHSRSCHADGLHSDRFWLAHSDGY
jgi:DNA polymerase I